MIISVNWLKKFTDIDLSIDELSTLIGARLVEIESVVDLGAKYKDVLIVRVENASKLEDSDHLNVVMIDDGGATTNIERDESGFIQVICGAQNISTGQYVAWLPPHSIVPNTYSKGEPFILESRKLRGYMSNGMIASAKELDLFDEHEGILVLDENLNAGSSFAEVYELNDYLLDIENKSLTHRPDCFSIIGFAREVAAISNKAFQTPDWLMNASPEFCSDSSMNVEPVVIIDDPELSSRYQAVVLSGADSSKKSPIKTQTYLARVGVRPINAVVDVTNYLMMLTGQPLHAFDYDKLVSVGDGKAEIHVRSGKDRETLELLDGRTIELDSSDVVISNGNTAIGLAGAMGGENTAIDDNTKNIIIESATFNLYNLRATQMRHGIFSEAITRFTKGQPASLTAPVLSDAVRLMKEWAGADCISGVIEDYPKQQSIIDIKFSVNEINGILGSAFSLDEITNTLINVEFSVDKLDDFNLSVKAPYWRADIHIVEDIAEEIGRLNGFDNINSVLPKRYFTAVRPNPFDDFKENLRSILARAGANEVLTYSFLHGDIIKKACQNIGNSYKITNSISPSLQYYRQSLTPSLLDLVHMNIKNSYNEFAIFEINKTHSKNRGLNNEGVPVELNKMALVYSNKDLMQGSSYYKVKNTIEYIFNVIGFKAEYVPIVEEDNIDVLPFEVRRAAVIKSALSGKVVGVIGEYKKSVIRGFKLSEYTAGFEIDNELLFNEVAGEVLKYSAISRYPSTERDICFKVGSKINYDSIIKSLNKYDSVDDMTFSISPIDIYSNNDSTKNITIRIKMNSSSHTLTNEEINLYINGFANQVESEVGAVVI